MQVTSAQGAALNLNDRLPRQQFRPRKPAQFKWMLGAVKDGCPEIGWFRSGMISHGIFGQGLSVLKSAIEHDPFSRREPMPNPAIPKPQNKEQQRLGTSDGKGYPVKIGKKSSARQPTHCKARISNPCSKAAICCTDGSHRLRSGVRNHKWGKTATLFQGHLPPCCKDQHTGSFQCQSLLSLSHHLLPPRLRLLGVAGIS